ncbi:MAG: class I SAM-dependent methyltransferase [Leptolyngbya sp. Prado105]|jgi:SAM-dependent methyltransferase|nr:class I SAM-dependent methyltransferase [Leptolyngbya sp. Prado105]
MADWVKLLNEYSNRDLEQRKVWYSPVVEAYDRGRPGYPEDLIRKSIEAAHLAPDAKILEVGCGSGTATLDFAKLGYEIDAVEPNPEFCRIAARNFAEFPKVTLFQQSFEEWQVKPAEYQIVLAANAWHWIASDIKYVKASETLKEGGALVLLWNMSLEPSIEVYQALNRVYQQYAPTIAPQYEGRDKQLEILRGLGRLIRDSGLFEPPMIESSCCERTYDTERYLDLLSSYSQYVSLDPRVREALFLGLRTTIEQQFQGKIQLFNLAAFQIARKVG